MSFKSTEVNFKVQVQVPIQYNTIQYNTIQYNTIQCNTEEDISVEAQRRNTSAAVNSFPSLRNLSRAVSFLATTVLSELFL